jgi:polar amino acid transport system substrate-binding protein
MKVFSSSIYWCIAIVVIFFYSNLAQADCARSYSIAYSSDYIPYQYQSESEAPMGLDIDITSAVMTELGCKFEFVLIPSKRAQLLLKSGSLDLMPAASITGERSAYAHFSNPYRNEAVAMFVRVEDHSKYQQYHFKDAIDNGLRTVAGLGGWYGSEYGKEKERALAAGVLRLNASTSVRIHQLLDKRVDVVVADLFVGYHHAIEANRLSEITPLPHLLNSEPVHYMLSKSSVSDKFVMEFNLALSAVLNSEEYQVLLEKYRPATGVPTN